MFTRKSAYAAAGDLTDKNLYWYAVGVYDLMQRPIDDRTSWLFLAAIHGINVGAWQQLKWLPSNATLPPQSDQDSFWNQCQHATWYFLPWHRGYLASLEGIVRAAIIKEGGPQDWALPYWNYSDTSDPRARTIPPAFTEPTLTLPNGTLVPNPLCIEQRYGSMPLPQQHVSLTTTLAPTHYTGLGQGVAPGFGGPITLFQHLYPKPGTGPGTLESQPHNVVHGDVGGFLGGNVGLMSDPETAALDPVFYVHHANIDRLWEVWLGRSSGNLNPSDATWLQGPADRHFELPVPNPGSTWQFAAQNVIPTTKLNYEYDNTQDPLNGISASDARRKRLGGS